MSALILSDLHAHSWPRFSTTAANGLNSRFVDLLHVLDQVENYIEHYHPRYLLILGDVTHRRFFVTFSVYNPLFDKICALSEKVERTILLVGNHDIEGRGVHSLHPFSRAGITVVDKPVWVELTGTGVIGHFVPYMSEGIADATRHTDVGFDGEKKILFAHYSLDGHVLNTEHEYALPSALCLDDVAEYDKVMFGHVHTPAIEQGGRIVYVGAPCHFDFGDSGPRYCWYMAPEGLLEALPLNAPQFVTCTYPRIPTAPLQYSGFLRVLNVPVKNFSEVKKEALELGWLDVVPIEEAVPSEAVKVMATRMMVGESVLRDYVARQYPDAAEPTREEIVGVGLDLLHRAEGG